MWLLLLWFQIRNYYFVWWSASMNRRSQYVASKVQQSMCKILSDNKQNYRRVNRQTRFYSKLWRVTQNIGQNSDKISYQNSWFHWRRLRKWGGSAIISAWRLTRWIMTLYLLFSYGVIGKSLEILYEAHFPTNFQCLYQ